VNIYHLDVYYTVWCVSDIDDDAFEDRKGEVQ
jgi:hypothetical protein